MRVILKGVQFCFRHAILLSLSVSVSFSKHLGRIAL
jgi:hypothetical protein